MKPSRFGTLRALFEFYETCEARGIALYGGGQFELGPGRGHIQHLASLFHADAPNDVAPGAYNGRPRDGLPREPAAAVTDPARSRHTRVTRGRLPLTGWRRQRHPGAPASLVERLSVPQRAGERRFASVFELLETEKGERLVRIAYTTDGTARRGPVTLRLRDLEKLRAALGEHPGPAGGAGLERELIPRDEVVVLQFLLADIIRQLRRIADALEGTDGQEEEGEEEAG